MYIQQALTLHNLEYLHDNFLKTKYFQGQSVTKVNLVREVLV
jgi:hypothetical protein